MLYVLWCFCLPFTQEGVYIYGLFLEGAGWDKRRSILIESTPKILFVQLPVLHMFAVDSTRPRDPKLYVCPLYKKPKRTDLNFITEVFLKTAKPPDHWILRGVALLCDIKWAVFLAMTEEKYVAHVTNYMCNSFTALYLVATCHYTRNCISVLAYWFFFSAFSKFSLPWLFVGSFKVNLSK